MDFLKIVLSIVRIVAVVLVAWAIVGILQTFGINASFGEIAICVALAGIMDELFEIRLKMPE